MEIVYDVNLVRFSELSTGDVFRYNYKNSQIYMKLLTPEVIGRCVDLEKGVLESCDPGTYVLKLEGQLVIK